jgi:hypothetical protein
MIFDTTTLFSNQQAIVATVASTNAIDLGVMGTPPMAGGPLARDLVNGGDGIALLVQVTEAFNNLTSLKIDIELETATPGAFTPDKVITLGTFLLAELVRGFRVPFRLLPDGITMRYIQLRYTVTGTAPTLGKITAGIVAAVQTNR